VKPENAFPSLISPFYSRIRGSNLLALCAFFSGVRIMNIARPLFLSSCALRERNLSLFYRYICAAQCAAPDSSMCGDGNEAVRLSLFLPVLRTLRLLQEERPARVFFRQAFNATDAQSTAFCLGLSEEMVNRPPLFSPLRKTHRRSVPPFFFSR